jgi:hypothetical protein
MAILLSLVSLGLLFTPSLALPMPFQYEPIADSLAQSHRLIQLHLRPSAIADTLHKRYYYYDEDAYRTRIIIGVVVSVAVLFLCCLSWYARSQRIKKLHKQQEDLFKQQQQNQELQNQLLQQQMERQNAGDNIEMPPPSYQANSPDNGPIAVTSAPPVTDPAPVKAA